MPHNSSAEMPEITAYSLTVGQMSHLSSAGPFFDEPLGEPTYTFGQPAQIQAWPDVDQETKLEFQKKYDEHVAEAAEDLKKEVFRDRFEEVDAEFDPDEEEEGMKKRDLRVVKIFVADRHPDIPLESAIVYESPKSFATEMTNSELYHTINIMELLNLHNEFRVGLLDKEATKTAGREVYLEAIRIRDLDMQVTAFTEFA